MDILKSLMSDKTAGVLMSGLVGRGFTQEQAENFLPEAVSSVMSALKGNAGAANIDSILGNIDIASIASKVGIDSSMVTNGLKFIIPGILDQMGGQGMSGMLGKIKSFF